MSKINWFFCLNDKNPTYLEYAKVAVKSACQYNINKHCLYDGAENDFTSFLRKHEVNLIKHRFSLFEEAIKADHHKISASIATGTYLRIDIPEIIKEQSLFTDRYYLYTDCDVLFMNDPVEICLGMEPEVACAGPEFHKEDINHFNAGVMWGNVSHLYETTKRLREFILANDFVFSAFDQGALNLFYKGCIERLPLELNWKPYWGYVSSASVVHFHGPKWHHYMQWKESPEMLDKAYLPMLTPQTVDAYERYTAMYNRFIE